MRAASKECNPSFRLVNAAKAPIPPPVRLPSHYYYDDLRLFRREERMRSSGRTTIRCAVTFNSSALASINFARQRQRQHSTRSPVRIARSVPMRSATRSRRWHCLPSYYKIIQGMYSTSSRSTGPVQFNCKRSTLARLHACPRTVRHGSGHRPARTKGTEVCG